MLTRQSCNFHSRVLGVALPVGLSLASETMEAPGFPGQSTPVRRAATIAANRDKCGRRRSGLVRKSVERVELSGLSIGFAGNMIQL
jgi:hypothetical protein